MGRERHGEGGFAQSVCLDGLAVPYQANREQKRAAPAASTLARSLAPERGHASGAPRQLESVQAEPDRLVRRRPIQVNDIATPMS
jgi:hypothetical protein